MRPRVTRLVLVAALAAGATVVAGPAAAASGQGPSCANGTARADGTAPGDGAMHGDGTVRAVGRAARPAATTPPGDWHVTWQDTFDGDALDTTKWATDSSAYYDQGRGQAGNPHGSDHKAEYNRPENLAVSGGKLTITAKRQPWPTDNPRYQWTSGLITTGSTADGGAPPKGAWVRPGDYVEMTAKLSGTVGTWPGFWTWNGPDPEVDAVEYHPDNPTTDEVGRPQVNQDYCWWDAGTDLSAGYHTYGAYLGADGVDFYLDGRRIAGDHTAFTADGAALIVNLSVNDRTAGGSDDGHPSPAGDVKQAAMSVDAVTVYHQ